MQIEIGSIYVYSGNGYVHPKPNKEDYCFSNIEIITEIDMYNISCECVNCKISFKYVIDTFFNTHKIINKTILI